MLTLFILQKGRRSMSPYDNICNIAFLLATYINEGIGEGGVVT